MASANIHTLRTMSAPGPAQTLTLTATPPATAGSPAVAGDTSPEGRPILRLRGAPAPTRRSVSWAADVVDNEGLGRKKSKVCCIYRRPREVDESSDESSSGSDSSSDSDADVEGGARKAKQPVQRRRPRRRHGHDHDHDHDHDHNEECHNHASQKRRPSPNAYERVPRNKPRDNNTAGGDAAKNKA